MLPIMFLKCNRDLWDVKLLATIFKEERLTLTRALTRYLWSHCQYELFSSNYALFSFIIDQLLPKEYSLRHISPVCCCPSRYFL